MLIGYARVSTQDQMSGSKAEHLELAEALKYARAGDTLVVWRLDRLGCSLKDLIEIVARLEFLSIGLKSLHESIDTSSSTGKLVFHLFGALAEFKGNLIRERTQAGLQAARGRKGGRSKVLHRNKRVLVVKLYYVKHHTIDQICQMMGISKPTLYKYVESGRSQ